MLKISVSDLHFVRPRGPIPTVEVDIDTLPASCGGCASVIQEFLEGFAEKHSEVVATIYIHVGPSVNFGRSTYSAFLGVAGPESVLKRIFEAFSILKDVSSRYSDYIRHTDGRCEVQIENGMIWLAEDAATWYTEKHADQAVELSDDEPVTNELNESDSGEELEADNLTDETQASIVSGRSEVPTRFRAARSDASIGAIRAQIEKVFGLPEGSVALCGKDKRPLRSDATIRTLRKRWD